jgi:predicted N-acetyltransferase YhbS
LRFPRIHAGVHFFQHTNYFYCDVKKVPSFFSVIAFPAIVDIFDSMKLVHWTRFSWDLARLPEIELGLDSHYHIRAATRDEEKTVRNVIFSAFSLDMDWADTLKRLRQRFEDNIDEAFAHKTNKEVHCIVLTHGSRIIGASVLNVSSDAENHLISGPSILNEYRNRGLGSALLYRSLLALREAGVVQALAVTKSNVPAAKFIYTKFNSVNAPYDLEPQLVDT